MDQIKHQMRHVPMTITPNSHVCVNLQSYDHPDWRHAIVVRQHDMPNFWWVTLDDGREVTVHRNNVKEMERKCCK